MKRTLAAVLCSGLAGCGLHAINDNSREVDNDRTLITAADQRAVLKVPATRDPATGLLQPDHITCAEPSPDIARLVSENSGSNAQVGAGLPIGLSASAAYGYAKGHAEGMAQLTDRLATIQILRDGMYRACEAYANGAIDRTAYALVLGHSERVMFGLLMAELVAGRKPQPLLSMGEDSSLALQVQAAQLDKQQADQELGGAVDDLLKAVPDVVKTVPNLVDLLTKGKLSGKEQALLDSVATRLPPKAQPLLKRVQAGAEQSLAKGDRLSHLLAQAGRAPAAPQVQAARPGVSSRTVAYTAAPPAAAAAGSDPVELERLRVMEMMMRDLIDHPTLDGIEVSCITLLSSPQLRSNAPELGDYCKTALVEVFKVKLAKNSH